MTKASVKQSRFSRFAIALFHIYENGSLILIYYFVMFYITGVFMGYDKDTTTISNAAFVIAASLGAVVFGFARAIDSSDKDKDRIVYSGERFLQGALLLMTASLFKYAAFTLGPLS